MNATKNDIELLAKSITGPDDDGCFIPPILDPNQTTALRRILADAAMAPVMERVCEAAKAYTDAPGQVRGEIYRDLCNELAALDAARKEQGNG